MSRWNNELNGESMIFIKRFIVFLSHAWINVDKDIDENSNAYLFDRDLFILRLVPTRL